MNVASDIVRMVDTVGFVPGLSLSRTLAMQIWQTVQVCHVRNCSLDVDSIRVGLDIKKE